MSDIHYMFDIECLGTGRDCIIVSVGAVKFKLKTGEILDTQYWDLGLGEQQRKGRSIDSSTIMWWANQSSDAQSALRATNRCAIIDFIGQFNKFIQEKGYYWAKGTNYDLEIISDLYKLYGQKTPFKYSKWLDARVYYYTGKQLGILPKFENACPHNALDDAIFQTKVVCKVFGAIQSNVGKS